MNFEKNKPLFLEYMGYLMKMSSLLDKADLKVRERKKIKREIQNHYDDVDNFIAFCEELSEKPGKINEDDWNTLISSLTLKNALIYTLLQDEEKFIRKEVYMSALTKADNFTLDLKEFYETLDI